LLTCKSAIYIGRGDGGNSERAVFASTDASSASRCARRRPHVRYLIYLGALISRRGEFHLEVNSLRGQHYKCQNLPQFQLTAKPCQVVSQSYPLLGPTFPCHSRCRDGMSELPYLRGWRFTQTPVGHHFIMSATFQIQTDPALVPTWSHPQASVPCES
jgi:hypothetical protein